MRLFLGKLRNYGRKTICYEQEVKERSNNIIIGGVPKQPEENTTNIIESILSALNAQTNINQCMESFRMGKSGNGPILAKFSNQQIKKTILKKIKERKGLKLSECELRSKQSDKNKKIYLNEDLPVSEQEKFF